MSKIVNKVRVKAEFPGYEIGDVLILNPSTGVFNFAKTTTEGEATPSALSAFDGVAARITDSIKQSFTKRDVMLYLDEYFEDISVYKIRTPREMEERIYELRSHMERIKEDTTFDELDREEAVTVWQNMLWEYEWILGRKEMYYTTTSPDRGGTIEQTLSEELPMDNFLENFISEDYIDGNALEAEKDDKDSITEDRKDS